jgi:hypothetical protein
MWLYIHVVTANYPTHPCSYNTVFDDWYNSSLCLVKQGFLCHLSLSTVSGNSTYHADFLKNADARKFNAMIERSELVSQKKTMTYPVHVRGSCRQTDTCCVACHTGSWCPHGILKHKVQYTNDKDMHRQICVNTTMHHAVLLDTIRLLIVIWVLETISKITMIYIINVKSMKLYPLRWYYPPFPHTPHLLGWPGGTAKFHDIIRNTPATFGCLYTEKTQQIT